MQDDGLRMAHCDHSVCEPFLDRGMHRAISSCESPSMIQGSY
jgi:hypothetical protein